MKLLEAAPAPLLIALALLAGGTCQLLLGTSYVAASLEPLSVEGGIEVAVVMQDEGEHGARFLSELEASESPVAFVDVATREDAMQGLREKRYYGALVIPENFTAAIDSFASDAPQAALVETYTNPGASTSGNLIAQRVTQIALERLRGVIRDQALANVPTAPTVPAGPAGTPLGPVGALTLEQGRFLAEPVHVQETIVNPVPTRGAQGLAPTYLAMGAWIGGYLGSVALERFRPQTQLRAHVRAAIVAGGALLQGVVATLAIAGVGLDMQQGMDVVFLLAAGTWMAYALVSLLMDLFGLAGILPAFAILALGLPASGAIYPVGLLPDLYQTLHGISPFSWLVEGLRTALYAPDAGDVGASLLALAATALACTAASVGLDLLRARRGGPGPADAAGE